MSTDNATSSGVDELIQRLQQEGLVKGQEAAEELLAAARKQAAEIVEAANLEAEKIIASATKEAQQITAAGEESLKLAARDTILRLNDELRQDFDRKVRGLVGYHMRDADFLKQLVLAIARKSVPEELTGALHLQILADEASANTSADPEHRDQLDDFIRASGGEALRDGLTFEVADSEVPGVRVQAKDDHLEIDLTAETITHLLIKYLSPRFRAIIDQQ
mgnify:CR=1 FL=1